MPPHLERDRLAEPKKIRNLIIALCLGGIVFLAQFLMVYIGTEMSFENGIDGGRMTYRAGKVFGLVVSVLYLMVLFSTCLGCFNVRPFSSFWGMIGLGVLASGLTLLFVIVRASASFLLYFEP